MVKQYRLVIFDWEGTLGDTLGQVLDCIASEARRLQFGELDVDLARQWVDLGLQNACKKLFPHVTSSQLRQLVDAVQVALMARHSEAYLFKGVEDLVLALDKKGIDLAIATNKGQHSLQRALQTTGLAPYFRVTRSAGQTPPKPCPQMLEEILEVCAVSVKDALMIGDSENDIHMAKSIGMDVIGVNFYHQEASSLLEAGAIVVFEDYQSIMDYLDGAL